MRWSWGLAVLLTAIAGCQWRTQPPRTAPSSTSREPPAQAAPEVCGVVPLPNERTVYRAEDESVLVCVLDEFGMETCRRELAAVYDASRRRCAPAPAPSAMPEDRPEYVAPTYGPVHVRGYYRRDGTYVRPHTRRRPRPR